MKRSREIHTVLAFYGITLHENTTDVKMACLAILKLVSDLIGRDPDLISIAAGPKHKSYKSVHACMEIVDFSRTDSLEFIFRTQDVTDTNLGYDTLFALTRTNKANWDCVLDSRSRFLQVRSEAALQVAREICGKLRPLYGIGYNLPFDHGPYYYAVGMELGGTEDFFRDRPDHEFWQQALLDQLYLHHRLLRAIYPLSFLTEIQLGARVHEGTLRAWIESDRRNGTLLSVTKQIVVWCVADDEISRISSELRRADRLLAEHHLDLCGAAGSVDSSDKDPIGSILSALTNDASNIDVFKKETDLRELTEDEITVLLSKGEPKKKGKKTR